MSLNAYKWIVNIWTEDRSRKVLSADFLDKESAERYAKKQEERIKAEGRICIITVDPLFRA